MQYNIVIKYKAEVKIKFWQPATTFACLFLHFDLQYFETPRSIKTLKMGKTFPIHLGVPWTEKLLT